MLDKFRYTAATDKDIFDLLISGGVKLSRKVLLAIARERGVFFSKYAEKEQIAAAMSMWTHDYLSVNFMVSKREQHASGDKRAFVQLPVGISKEELDDAVREYQKSVSGLEEVATTLKTSERVRLNISYDEVDYSKTRLIQRQRRDAPIDLEFDESRVIFRMPANERARRIVEGLCAQVKRRKLSDVDIENISLADLSSGDRSKFFLKMMQSISGYELQTVVGLKFSNSSSEEASDEDDSEVEESATTEVISRINNIYISGENLFQTPEYKQFNEKGFFFTAVTWRSKQKKKPHDVMQFDVSFENPQEGTGFKYGVRIAKNADASSSADFQPLEVQRQPSVWRLIEQAAVDALKEIRTERSSR